jgi:hypothetical protein
METVQTPRIVLCGALALALTSSAVACADDDENGDGGSLETPTASEDEAPAAQATSAPQDTTVEVSLVEYAIQPAPATVGPGNVTFDIENVGGSTHEFVVIRTDLSAEALPTTPEGGVDEAAPGLLVVGEVEEIAPGATTTLPLEAQTDKYVLVCNVIEDSGISHFQQGMAVAFEVTA